MVLITGGAGFIGSNLAARLLLTTNSMVRILDNVSRQHVNTNIQWLQSLPGAVERLQVHIGDVRSMSAVMHAAQGCAEIYHLAAQVAVTTSVSDPLADFEINAGGTLNVLEAARCQKVLPFVLFTSTNKVYGQLKALKVKSSGSRYIAEDTDFIGSDEETPLDFHSPYGCSKGCADQYVRDYARIYGLPTVVLRMSCICGPRQFGTEDQGWVAHFLYSILRGDDITIYGDGLQVRDILHVDDLLDAMQLVRGAAATVGGRVFNVGGGMERAISVNEMIAAIEGKLSMKGSRHFAQVRPGDQPIYVSNTSLLQSMAGWSPRRSIDRILDDLQVFARENASVRTKAQSPSASLFSAEAVA